MFEQARRAIRSTPECVAKDIPKGEAIRALTPDIREMHSKGYDWTAIAQLLTEQGVAITAVTLTSHLQQAKRAKRRKARGGSDGTERNERSAPKGRREHELVPTRNSTGGAKKDTDKAAPAPAVDTPEARPGSFGDARAIQDADSRRSALVLEEDTDDV